MVSPSPISAIRSRVVDLVRGVPPGRVITTNLIATTLGVAVPIVTTCLDKLSEDERQVTPWHRVVAKGGAIGWGLHRDEQFARLIREGVPVSPAGIVRDMVHVAIANVDDLQKTGGGKDSDHAPAPPSPSQRSRGMKSHT